MRQPLTMQAVIYHQKSKTVHFPSLLRQLPICCGSKSNIFSHILIAPMIVAFKTFLLPFLLFLFTFSLCVTLFSCFSFRIFLIVSIILFYYLSNKFILLNPYLTPPMFVSFIFVISLLFFKSYLKFYFHPIFIVL